MIAPDIAPSEDTTPSKIVLRSSIFRKEREMSWLELEDYLARAEKKGIAALGPDEQAVHQQGGPASQHIPQDRAQQPGGVYPSHD